MLQPEKYEQQIGANVCADSVDEIQVSWCHRAAVWAVRRVAGEWHQISAWSESGIQQYSWKLLFSICYCSQAIFREVFCHEYGKIPRHTGQNPITEGDLEWILTKLLWTEWTVTSIWIRRNRSQALDTQNNLAYTGQVNEQGSLYWQAERK